MRKKPFGTIMQDELAHLFDAREGHFRFESGHHGRRWLDLERLCLHPERVRPFATELARRLEPLGIDAVCGPLNEGAFVALMVGECLDVAFTYTERFEQPSQDTLFPITYRLPPALRPMVHGKRVAIVNDVINAGSAVRGTYTDLTACGADIVGLGALLVLGSSASRFASTHALTLETLAAWPSDLWEPSACPLCAAGVPLEKVG